MSTSASQEMLDGALIDKIQHSSPDERAEAVRALYLKCEGLVRTYVGQRIHPSDAADVEHDVWGEIISSAGRVRLRSESARGWVIGIARRVGAGYYQRRAPEQETIDEATESAFRVPEAVERREAIRTLRAAWRALTPEQRLVVFLADVVGAPISEVIRWVGRSRQAIYAMHTRAKEAILSLMELIESGEEPESEWLESVPHTNMVIDLHPDLSDEEREFLARIAHIKPAQLFESFEVGMALFIEPSQQYLETLDRWTDIFHLVLLSRQGLDEYLAEDGESCDVYLFEMTIEENGLTVDRRARPLKTRAGWRLVPDNEGSR